MTIHRAGNCGNCKFSTTEAAGGLACRRYPPKMDTFLVGHDGTMQGDQPSARGYLTHQVVTFPTTFAELWCGEHIARVEGLS